MGREANMRFQLSWISGAAVCPPRSLFQKTDRFHTKNTGFPNQNILRPNHVPGCMLDAEGTEEERSISLIA